MPAVYFQVLGVWCEIQDKISILVVHTVLWKKHIKMSESHAENKIGRDDTVVVELPRRQREALTLKALST